jgi:hypothetical protein
MGLDTGLAVKEFVAPLLLVVPVTEPFEFSVPVNVVSVFQVRVTVLPLMEPLTPPQVGAPFITTPSRPPGPEYGGWFTP